MNAEIMGQILRPKPDAVRKIATPHPRLTAGKTAPTEATVTRKDDTTVEVVGDHIESGVRPDKLLRSRQLVVIQRSDEESYSLEHAALG